MNDLRIGSYLWHNGSIVRVSKKQLANILVYGTKGYRRIRLNIDVLLKCGFYKDKGECKLRLGNMIAYTNGSSYFFEGVFKNPVYLNELQEIARINYGIEIEYIYD